MIPDSYVWLVWSSAFLLPWLAAFALFPMQRSVMLWASLLTMPLGLTEPLFVPAYWNPPSLFDLLLPFRLEVPLLRGDLLEVVPDGLEVVRHLLDARGRDREVGELVDSPLDVRARVADLVLRLLFLGLATGSSQRSRPEQGRGDGHHPDSCPSTREQVHSVTSAPVRGKPPRWA